jgi:pimeloyl-ACP methyl ester carboxylesterase
MRLGYFGASTGAAAALVAASRWSDRVGAVVSRGGRPDLARAVLPDVTAPTLLIVGGADVDVLALNRQALALLGGPRELVVIPGASHLFPEPGALEKVARLAAGWFLRYLTTTPAGERVASEAAQTAVASEFGTRFPRGDMDRQC